MRPHFPRSRAVAWAACIAWSVVPVSAAASPQHNVHVGLGWQNTGASRSLTWEPGIQGSRKDVPVVVGWSLVGSRRLYYAPFARLKYTNAWSMAGAVNLLGVDLGFGGLGVHLAKPPSARTPEDNVGRWFATFEVNFANLRLGGNVAPRAPKHPDVPDPDARRAMVTEYRDTDRAHELEAIQRYPFGPYRYVELAFPLQFRVWRMVRPDLGAGFFLESTSIGLEWPLDRKVDKPALVYNILLGATLTFGPARR